MAKAKAKAKTPHTGNMFIAGAISTWGNTNSVEFTENGGGWNNSVSFSEAVKCAGNEIEDNGDNDVTIYKLVPVATVKKDNSYKVIDI